MMQGIRKSSNSYLGGLILIVALISYLIFAIAFLHVHIDPSGHLISHSHPFAKSTKDQTKFPDHSHTSFEFLYFYMLTFLDELILLSVFVFLIILLQQRIKKPANFFIPLSKIFSFYNNRAPPAFSILPV